MAKIEKSEESGPHLFFLGAPWAEKMTFSKKKPDISDLETHIS